MNAQVSIESEGIVVLSETAPTYLWEYKLPDTHSYGASGHFGDILFQQVQRTHYALWYNNFQFRKSERVSIGRPAPIYALRIVLNNTFQYAYPNSTAVTFYEWGYNFVYIPASEEKINVKDKPYGSIDIHFDPAYLNTLAAQFPHLADWLGRSGQQDVAWLCNINQVATMQMMRCVSQLLNSPYPGALRNIHYDALVTELLLMVLEETYRRQRRKLIRFANKEVETLYALKTFITRNMDKPLDIDELAKRFDGAPRTLKRRFYTLFGINLYNYLLEIRMEQAGLLLLETDTSIESIAALTGYRSFANFSTAFKKYHGHPPRFFRSR